MNVESASNDTIIPSDVWRQGLEEQLANWRLRLHALAAEIAKMNAERSVLEAKLKAAEAVLGRPLMPEINPDGRPLSIREGIELLMKDGKHRSGSLIRQSLVAAGFNSSKIGPTSGAFYNALARLAHRGVLVKSESGVYQMKTVRR